MDAGASTLRFGWWFRNESYAGRSRRPSRSKRFARNDIRSSRDRPIQRLLAEDPNGTLNIGKSTSLDRRYKQYISGLKCGRGHSSANLMHYLAWRSPGVRRLLETEIVVSYKKVSLERLGEVEEAYLHNYLLVYGETPLLNSAIPNRYSAYES